MFHKTAHQYNHEGLVPFQHYPKTKQQTGRVEVATGLRSPNNNIWIMHDCEWSAADSAAVHWYCTSHTCKIPLLQGTNITTVNDSCSNQYIDRSLCLAMLQPTSPGQERQDCLQCILLHKHFGSSSLIAVPVGTGCCALKQAAGLCTLLLQMQQQRPLPRRACCWCCLAARHWFCPQHLSFKVHENEHRGRNTRMHAKGKH